MKNLLFIVIFALSNFAISQNQLHFKAEIANRNGDVIYIKDTLNKTIKEIKVDDKGIFKASFEIANGNYVMFDGVEYAQLYLKNGYDLILKTDAKEFDESIVFEGKGSEENNYLAKEVLLNEKYSLDQLIKLNPEEFDKLMIIQKKDKMKQVENLNLDSKFIEKEKRIIDDFYKFVIKYYNEKKKFKN